MMKNLLNSSWTAGVLIGVAAVTSLLTRVTGNIVFLTLITLFFLAIYPWLQRALWRWSWLVIFVALVCYKPGLESAGKMRSFSRETLKVEAKNAYRIAFKLKDHEKHLERCGNLRYAFAALGTDIQNLSLESKDAHIRPAILRKKSSKGPPQALVGVFPLNLLNDKHSETKLEFLLRAKQGDFTINLRPEQVGTTPYYEALFLMAYNDFCSIIYHSRDQGYL